jgi:hypothetical protein
MTISTYNMNRKLLIVISILFLGLNSSFAQFRMGNTLTPLVGNTYPIILSNDAQGGLHQVATIAARNAIPALRRQEGMLCAVADDGFGASKTYQLKGGILDANWVEFTSGSSVSATAPLSYNSGTGVLGIAPATSSAHGYLLSTDWNTFNNKVSFPGLGLTTTKVWGFDAHPTTIAGYGLTDAAPISGSANYIQNQNSAAQTANQWITGTGVFNGSVTASQYNGSGAGLTGTALGLTSGATNMIFSADGDRNPNTKLPSTSPLAVRFDFATAASCGTGGGFAGVMTYAPLTGTTATGGDASYQLAFGSTAVNGGGIPMLRIRKGIEATWNSWYTLVHEGNISSFTAPAPAIVTKSGNYTAVSTDETILVSTTATITLPAASSCLAKKYTVKNIGAGITVTVKSNGGTIDGLAAGTGISGSMQWQGWTFQSDGTNWYIISRI